ncbi:MAG: hypothetical protein KIG32_06560 [Ruminiclostridium sp.]|nr:hypothetical protein [Ruminiclostridium sp.]
MTDLHEIFQQAKERLDIRTVAEHYGLELDRIGKACCPFHHEKTPSFAINEAGQYFKCFGCGEGGDVITLAGKLLGISKPIDILKRLNADFSLGLDLEKKEETPQEIKKRKLEAAKRKRTKDLQKAFDDWTSHAFCICTEYAKLLRLWGVHYKPKTAGEELNVRYIEYLSEIDFVELLCKILTYGDQKQLRRFYEMCWEEVNRIELRLEHYLCIR